MTPIEWWDVIEWGWTVTMTIATVASGWLMRQGLRDMQAASRNAAMLGNARRGIFAAMLTRHSVQTFVPASFFVITGVWSIVSANPTDIPASRYATSAVVWGLGGLWSLGVLLDVVDRRRIRRYRGRKSDPTIVVEVSHDPE